MTSIQLPTHQDTSETGSTPKEKNLLPQGANSFLSGKIPYAEGSKTISIVVSLKNVSIPFKQILTPSTRELKGSGN